MDNSVDRLRNLNYFSQELKLAHDKICKRSFGINKSINRRKEIKS